MELRVHGVGGPSPQTVMGCPQDAVAVATWRSEPTAFTAVRRSPTDPSVLAYDWRPLTSGSRAFALWPILLPFCLVNLAGWMRPRRSPAVAPAARVLAVWIGYATTVGAVVWLLFAGQVLTHSPDLLDDAIVRRLPGTEATARWWLGTRRHRRGRRRDPVASVHVGPAARSLPTTRMRRPNQSRWRVWSRRCRTSPHRLLRHPPRPSDALADPRRARRRDRRGRDRPGHRPRHRRSVRPAR